MQEDTEVFEITDFTTASDWERFISDFEETIRLWDIASGQTKASSQLKLKPNEISDGSWIEKSETLKFSKAYFAATHIFLKCKDDQSEDETESNAVPIAFEDGMSSANDFPSRAHPIVRFYGLREFIVISPSGNTEAITSEDKLKLLLSSAAIALNNTQCEIPIFVQLSQRERKYYQGICSSSEVTCHYDMVHFNKAPGNFRCLSELLGLYKEKLGFSSIDCPPVTVTIRFSHILKEWPSEWQYYEDPLDSENPPVVVSQAVDFVCYQDPIQELQLFATWPSLSEQLVADSQFHSDLDSLQAPRWSLRLKFRDNLESSFNDTLMAFFQLSNSPSKDMVILGKMIEDLEASDAELEVRQALDRMANQNMSMNLPQLGRQRVKWNLPQSIKATLLSYIFDESTNYATIDASILKDFRAFKSAQFDSLPWRIILTLAFVNSSYKDLSAVAYMWREIISGLRRYWEKCTTIPRMEEGLPNQSTCLLAQKLQLLGCCIKQKIKRESAAENIEIELRTTKKGEESEDDEFYDAEENVDETQLKEPEGRLEVLEDFKLLSGKAALYVPITQDPTPMTEDMLQEHADILFQLGTSTEGAALRAKMQCASLISDMEAFKAANPGAQLEDFVRWYSPRDFADGALSQRMMIPGNTWRECWDGARPVPVHRQKRLFDYTKEAEKVLHYLASFTLDDLVQHFMPVLVHAAISQLVRERDVVGQLTDDEFPLRVAEITKCVNNGHFAAALNIIRDGEVSLLQILSIRKKLEIVHAVEFPNDTFDWHKCKAFVLSLVQNSETEVLGGARDFNGRLVKSLFHESSKELYRERTSIGDQSQDAIEKLPVLSAPFAKEFILRVSVPRPAVYSKTLPQRMYCLLSEHEFRLAGSFAEDTVYF